MTLALGWIFLRSRIGNNISDIGNHARVGSPGYLWAQSCHIDFVDRVEVRIGVAGQLTPCLNGLIEESFRRSERSSINNQKSDLSQTNHPITLPIYIFIVEGVHPPLKVKFSYISTNNLHLLFFIYPLPPPPTSPSFSFLGPTPS